MPWQNEMLRFQGGVRSHHAAPGASIEEAPAGIPSQVGEQLVILVDLTPPLPHRSREIRVIAAETYWHSTGSVVARLRRALAAANRHLIKANAQSISAQRTTGQITCVAFLSSEIFLGQVGPAQAKLQLPAQPVEFFPQATRQLLPLGSTRPPLIHIGYAKVTPGSILQLASATVADKLNSEITATTLEEYSQVLDAQLATQQSNGCIVLTQYLAEETVPASAPRQKPSWWHRLPQTIPTGIPHFPDETPKPAGESPPESPEKLPRWKLPAWQRPTLHWPQIQRPKLTSIAIDPRRFFSGKHHWQLPRLSVKPFFQALLPRPVAGNTKPRTRQVPTEKKPLMGGMAVGFLLVMLLITISTYLQFSGAERAENIFAAAQEAWQNAYTTQQTEDWEHVAALTEKVISLAPEHQPAQEMQHEAQSAIDALENAAILELHKLGEVHPSPSPHRLLVADSWLYWLNPSSNEVLGLSLSEDGITPAADAQLRILKEGELLRPDAQPVGKLIALAWMEPHTGYPDGALLIYGDGGRLYIYEPTIGPHSRDEQQLLGELAPGSITLMETFGNQFYLINRQQNQILKYLPVNGIYDAPPRPYFAADIAPQLQNVCSLDIDGEIYLLFGNGKLRTYFNGGEGIFQTETPPGADFQPTLMSVDTTSTEGLIYLGDPQRESIVAFNKEGQFQHQFRVMDKVLRSLEALANSKEPNVLYLIADNQLYAAPLPSFTAQ
ncbi:MAG: hypothetical protein U9Q70_08560 [Chloroflexota bacterium]|nr:hypothetical protein [Chloroflexota bacterium]